MADVGCVLVVTGLLKAVVAHKDRRGVFFGELSLHLGCTSGGGSWLVGSRRAASRAFGVYLADK